MGVGQRQLRASHRLADTEVDDARRHFEVSASLPPPRCARRSIRATASMVSNGTCWPMPWQTSSATWRRATAGGRDHATRPARRGGSRARARRSSGACGSRTPPCTGRLVGRARRYGTPLRRQWPGGSALTRPATLRRLLSSGSTWPSGPIQVCPLDVAYNPIRPALCRFAIRLARDLQVAVAADSTVHPRRMLKLSRPPPARNVNNRGATARLNAHLRALTMVR